jgi:Leucine-rich repeat (LRR) protein
MRPGRGHPPHRQAAAVDTSVASVATRRPLAAAFQRGSPRGEAAGGPGAAALLEVLRGARSSGSLTLSGRKLLSVPPALLTLADLRAEGDAWWEAVDLTKLDLSHNELASLPPGLASAIPSLVTLKLNHNSLRGELPSFAPLQALKSLDLSHNQLLDAAAVEGLAALVELSLCHNQLVALPDLSASSRLEVLRVDGNQLSELAASLPVALPLLRTLSAASNRLSALPAGLGSLGRLRELEVARNALDALPDSIVGCGELTRCDARENAITVAPLLPPMLDTVLLGHNRLRSIDRMVDALVSSSGAPRLVVLDVSNNSLECLPEATSQLLGLKALDASNNNLATLPFGLGFLG